MKFYDQLGIGEFLIEAQGCQVGDELLIIGPTTGVIETILKSMRVDDSVATSVKRGATITFEVPEKIRPSDKLYKLVPVA